MQKDSRVTFGVLKQHYYVFTDATGKMVEFQMHLNQLSHPQTATLDVYETLREVFWS